MTASTIAIRRAGPADIPAIRRLHGRSLRRLGREHYDAWTLERVIEGGTFQPELLRGGRYRLALIGDQLVGAGGWLDSGPPAPAAMPGHSRPQRRDTALIRAVYVDPDFARQGIGGRLMAVIEAEARATGKARAELLSTAMAVRFYSRLGYTMEGPLSLAVANGPLVEVFAMAKRLSPADETDGTLAPPAAQHNAEGSTVLRWAA